MQVKYITALVFSVFVAIFTLQNVSYVSIQILAWEMKTSMALLIILTFFLGGVSAIIFSSAKIFRKTKKIKELEGEVKLLKNEIFKKESLLSKSTRQNSPIAPTSSETNQNIEETKSLE